MRNSKIRKITVAAILSAISIVLMFFSFSVPFMPFFIKMDFSEVPALIATFALGPWWGVAVCLIKNVVNGLFSTTGWVGEFCNFLLGVLFVLPAGYIYKFRKSRKTALIGSLTGAIVMAAVSLPVNYFITYPMYAKFMPIEQIIGLYQKIFSGVNGLFECLLVFNVPYNILKGVLCAAIAFVIYKRISRMIKR